MRIEFRFALYFNIKKVHSFEEKYHINFTIKSLNLELSSNSSHLDELVRRFSAYKFLN